jgi:hypothetical protein
VDVDRLDERSDLYEAGLTSHASVNLMLALEEHFEIEFRERMLGRGGAAGRLRRASNAPEGTHSTHPRYSHSAESPSSVTSVGRGSMW